MKIKITAFLAFFALATFSMNAQTTVTATGVEPVVVVAQDSRVEITADQLPEPIRKTLKTDAYKDWTISKAFHVKGGTEDGIETEHYEVVMKSNDRETTLKLDKDGNIIE